MASNIPSEDGEDDYMSDKFLQGCSAEDIRPGLPKVAKEKRAHEIFKKKLACTPKRKQETERLRLKEGLNTAISNENKGFKMLAKMGYQPGMSLGKSNEGIKEPINIINDLDSKRLHPEKKLKSSTPIDNAKREKRFQEIENKFKRSHSAKSTMRLIISYYSKAQSACYNLNQTHGIDFPDKEFYWPKSIIADLQKKKKKDDDSSSEEEEDGDDEYDEELFEIPQNLLTLNTYMRDKYYFCVFCGSKFECLQGLQDFCLGPSIEQHDL